MVVSRLVASTGPDASSRRDDIDTLRAIACIALVSYHVVGSHPGAGLHLPPEYWLSRFNQTFVDMRMPLFSFISGFVFVASGTGRGAGARLAGKARRLLVPMLVVGTLFWALRSLTVGPQGPLWHIAVLPYAHFWYLQATFVLMAVLIGAIYITQDRASAMRPTTDSEWRVGMALLGLTGFLWLWGARAEVNIFAVNNALYIGPFFFAGFILARSRRGLKALLGGGSVRRVLGGGISALAVLMGALLALEVEAVTLAGPARRAMTLVLGAAACGGLMLLRPRSALMARLGRASYAVYLFHVFFTAGTRIVLLRIWPDMDVTLIWILALSAGLIGPVVVQWGAFAAPMGLSRFLGLALFGVRIPPKASPPAQAQAEGAYGRGQSYSLLS
ncbi:hypothetical protein A9Q95_06640 [Rhodobacterales bacterium 59_46_T64]|jgi:peptidoglycan/LPS O-acetylase OafA/YrhL|nr:hypothetical protein A9Q95_06640 [Rhodobacterales bacterium 59_46_T64]